MLKIINTAYPDWLNSFLSVYESIGSVTRQQINLVIPFSKNATGAATFAVTGPKKWNSRPFNITSTASHASFQSKLRNFIVSYFNCS